MTKARRNLIAFTEHTFSLYHPGRHHYLIADKLQAIERGEIDRLMIFAPPRHGKSETASIRFPAWYLGRNPQKQVIACSYTADLAYTFSKAVRDTIDSAAFRDVFQDVTLDHGSTAVAKWALSGKANNRASYIAAGVGGPITGEGADLLIIDDPIKNDAEAESEVYRNNLWNWYTTTARTRLQPNGAIVVILTRWHEDDLAGRLRELEKADPEADKWDVLRLPAIDEAGHALWPEKYNLDALGKLRATLGARKFEALYQGQPTAPEGALFKRAWFSRYEDKTPGNLRKVVRYWDLAATRGGDYTSGALVGIDTDETLHVLDIVRLREEWPEVRKVIVATAMQDGMNITQGIEVAGMQTALYQDIMTAHGAAAVKWEKVTIRANESKQVRAGPWAARAEAGKVVLMRGDWNAAFLAEVTDFPYGQHDDSVDAVSGANIMLMSGRRAKTAII